MTDSEVGLRKRQGYGPGHRGVLRDLQVFTPTHERFIAQFDPRYTTLQQEVG